MRRGFAGPREPSQAAHAPDGGVVRRVAGDHQPQRDERLIGGASAQRFERAIKGQRPFGVNLLAQRRRDRLALPWPAVEEVAVDGMELHGMGCAPRRTAVPVAALLLAAANLAAAPAVNPAAAIADAAGHPAGRHLRAETAFERDGQAQTRTLEVAGPARLDRICAADLCRGTWFDGDHAATFGINGTPLPAGGADDALERTYAAIASTAFAEPAFLRAGGSVSPPASANGELRFAVTAPRGAELVAVADARTRRLTGVELPDRTLYRRLAATVSGSTVLYASLEYDRIVEPGAPLEPPAGPHVAVGRSGTVPLVSAVLPIVPCTVAAQAANCLIDTGTTPSAVTLAFAERLGLEPRGRIEIGGLATYLTGVIDAGPLSVGPATFERLHLAVVPSDRLAPFDVILGSDALASLRIGFESGTRVSIAKTGDAAAGDPIALEFAGGLPYAQVRLGDREHSEPMLVDTGDSGLVSIGYDEYREDTALFTVQTAGSARGLGAAPMDALRGELDRARIGGRSLDRVPIAAVRGQHIGHLGFAFAARCRPYVIDLGQSRIECGAPEPRPAASPG